MNCILFAFKFDFVIDLKAINLFCYITSNPNEQYQAQNKRRKSKILILVAFVRKQ